MPRRRQVGDATIEYLDDVGLRYFLDHRVASFSGILQKWIDPKGNHNSVLHCVWSKAMCQVTCKTNSKALSDKRVGVYERAVTFEGAENLTTREPVSQQTYSHIEQVCANMASHVAQMAEGCLLTTFSSYWKVRPDGKIAFLWCSSLKSTSSSRDDEYEGGRGHKLLPSRPFSPVMSVPHDVDSTVKTDKTRPYVCPVSNLVLSEADAKHYITYKMIIAEHDASSQHRAVYEDGRARPSSASFRPSSGRTPRQPLPGEAPPTGVPHRPSSAKGAQHHTQQQAGAVADSGQLPETRGVPPLIQKWEMLRDESIYSRLTSDATFLYKRVRVSESVARRYSAYVESASELDSALASLGGGKGVAIVPNTDGAFHRPPSRKSTASPFLDILGDTIDDGGYDLLKPAPPARQSVPALTGAALWGETPASIVARSLPGGAGGARRSAVKGMLRTDGEVVR